MDVECVFVLYVLYIETKIQLKYLISFPEENGSTEAVVNVYLYGLVVEQALWEYSSYQAREIETQLQCSYIHFHTQFPSGRTFSLLSHFFFRLILFAVAPHTNF